MGNVIWIFLAPFLMLFRPQLKRRMINTYSNNRTMFINETKDLNPTEWATIRSTMISNVDSHTDLETTIDSLSSLSEDEAFYISLSIYNEYYTCNTSTQNTLENIKKQGLINPDKFLRNVQLFELWPRLIYLFTTSSCFDTDSYTDLSYIWEKLVKNSDETFLSVFERLRFQRSNSTEINSTPLPENTEWLKRCKLSPIFGYLKDPDDVANGINKIFKEFSAAFKKYPISKKLILSYLNKKNMSGIITSEYSDDISWFNNELANFAFDYSNVTGMHSIYATGKGDYRNLRISLISFNGKLSFNVSANGNKLEPDIITTKKGYNLKNILLNQYGYTDQDTFIEVINKNRSRAKK